MNILPTSAFFTFNQCNRIGLDLDKSTSVDRYRSVFLTNGRWPSKVKMGFLVPCEEEGSNKCGVDRKSGIQALGVPVQVLIPSALEH